MKDHISDWDGLLVLDAGDLFAPRDTVDPNDAEMVFERAEAFVEHHGSMGMAAQALGDRDLALGRVALLKLQSKAKFPFLAANVVDASTGVPVFGDSIVVERAGIKVGIIGLTSQSMMRRAALEAADNLRIADPLEVARQQVASLREKGARIIVALAHLSVEECQRIGEANLGINVFVGSSSQQMMYSPLRAGDAVVVDAYMKGKYLGALSLLVGKDDGGSGPLTFVDPNERSNLVNEVSQTRMRVESRRRALEQAKESVADGPPGDPGRERNIEWLQSSLNDMEKELAELEKRLEAMPDKPIEGSNFILFRQVSMSKELTDEPGVTEALAKLKEKYPALAVPGH